LAAAETMDLLKKTVPIWKKEIYPNNETKWIQNCEGCKMAAK